MTKNTKDNGPDPMDIHVGKRLKARRTLLGLSQEKLADSVGLTFQQIQKYERGANRISASRLHQLCEILDVTVNYFFESFVDPNDKKQAAKDLNSYGMSDNTQEAFGYDSSEDILYSKESLELLRVYYSVKDSSARKDLMKVIKNMAENLSQK